MTYGDLGSISHGTLRAEDLLEAFANELDDLLWHQSRRFPRREYRALIRAAYRMLRAPELPDDAGDLVNELQDALSEFAPPYCYFGAHEGDGSDFGFWMAADSLSDAFDGIRVSDTGEVPRDYRGEVLHVNDHGNITLYVARPRGKLREVWAIV